MPKVKEQFCTLILRASHINGYPNTNPDPPEGIPLGIGDVCLNDIHNGLIRGFSTAVSFDHPRNSVDVIHHHLQHYDPFEITPSMIRHDTSLACSIVEAENDGKEISVGAAVQVPKLPANFSVTYELKASTSSTAALLFDPKPAKGYELASKEPFGRYIRENYSDLIKNVRTVFPNSRLEGYLVFLTSIWRVSKYAVIAHLGCSENVLLGGMINVGSVAETHAHWGTWHDSTGGPNLPTGVWAKSNAPNLIKKIKDSVANAVHAISDINPLYDPSSPFTVMFGGYATKEKTNLASKPDVQKNLITEPYVVGIEWLCIITGTFLEEAMDFVASSHKRRRRDEDDEDDGDDGSGGKKDNSRKGRLSGIKKKYRAVKAKGSGHSGMKGKGKGKAAADAPEDGEGCGVIELGPTEVALNYILAMCPAERAMVHTAQVQYMMAAAEEDDEDIDLVDWLRKRRPKVRMYNDNSGFASFAVGEFERKLLTGAINEEDYSSDDSIPDAFFVRPSVSGMTADTSFALSESGKSLGEGSTSDGES